MINGIYELKELYNKNEKTILSNPTLDVGFMLHDLENRTSTLYSVIIRTGNTATLTPYRWEDLEESWKRYTARVLKMYGEGFLITPVKITAF